MNSLRLLASSGALIFLNLLNSPALAQNPVPATDKAKIIAAKSEKPDLAAMKAAINDLDQRAQKHVHQVFQDAQSANKLPIFIMGEFHTDLYSAYGQTLIIKHVKAEAQARNLPVTFYAEEAPRRVQAPWSIANSMGMPGQCMTVVRTAALAFGLPVIPIDIESTRNYPVNKKNSPIFPPYTLKEEQVDDLGSKGMHRRDAGMAYQIIKHGTVGILETGAFHAKGVADIITTTRPSKFHVSVINPSSDPLIKDGKDIYLKKVDNNNPESVFDAAVTTYIFGPKTALQLSVPNVLVRDAATEIDFYAVTRLETSLLASILGDEAFERYKARKFENNSAADIQKAIERAPKLVDGLLNGRYRISWSNSRYNITEAADAYAQDPKFFDRFFSSLASRYLSKENDVSDEKNPKMSLTALLAIPKEAKKLVTDYKISQADFTGILIDEIRQQKSQLQARRHNGRDGFPMGAF